MVEMGDENMESWESKMTASERRILLSHFVAEAMAKVMDA